MLKYLTTFLILFFSHVIPAQNQQFSDIIETYHSEKNFNGSIIIATNGKIDFIKSIGLANREHNIPITNKSKYKIASVTKTFTAVLIMKLDPYANKSVPEKAKHS